MDRSIVISIISSQSESELESISDFFTKLLEKAAALINLNDALEQSQPQAALLIQRNLKSLVHSMGNIQQCLSLTLFKNFTQYNTMLKLILQKGANWQEQRLLKAGVLGISKVIRCYNYYSTSMQFQKTIHSSQFKHPLTYQIQEQLHLLWAEFFSQECTNLLELLIASAGIADSFEDEDLVEQEEENYNEELRSELQCPIYNLSLSCIEQLFIRYPQQCFENIKKIFDHLYQNNFQFHNQKILDSIYAVIGLLPRIVQRLGMPRQDLYQVVNIQYLLVQLSQSTEKLKIRRCAVLAHRYILSLEQNQTIEVIKLVLFLIANQNDRVVQYECLMCIKQLAQGLEDERIGLIEWNLILEQVAPTVVGLLENFSKTNIVWPILQLLSKLIQKCQYQSGESVRNSFEKANLMHLMSTQSELLVGALCDMLKSIIVSFPPNTPLSHIFHMGFTLVQNNIRQKNQVLPIYKLWYFLVQEYSSVQNMDNVITQMFMTNLPTILEDNDISNIASVIYLIEEHILINVIPYKDLPNILNIIEQKFNIANQIASHEESYPIKTACMNILTSIMLIMLNEKKYEDLALFKTFIVLVLQDYLRISNEQNFRHLLTYKTQSVSFMNRIILQDFNSFFQLLLLYNLSLDQYFGAWIQNMNYITARHARKLNMLSLMLVIKHISTQTFVTYLEQVLKECFPEVHMWMNELQNQKTIQKSGRLQNQHARLDEARISDRKDQLRKSQMYDEINLLQFFQQKMRDAIEVHQMNEEQLKSCLQDQSNFTTLVEYMSYN